MGSIVSQGIGVATGIQDKFSWASVAGAAVSAQFGKRLGLKPLIGTNADFSIGNIAEHVESAAARMIASGATRSLIEGSDFGDNIMAALPDVIGQTIGNAIAGGMTGRGAATCRFRKIKIAESACSAGGALPALRH